MCKVYGMVAYGLLGILLSVIAIQRDSYVHQTYTHQSTGVRCYTYIISVVYL